MRSLDIVICPITGEEVALIKMWESRLPNGKVIRYGQLQRHTHVGQECEWLYLVRPLMEREEVFPSVFI